MIAIIKCSVLIKIQNINREQNTCSLDLFLFKYTFMTYYCIHLILHDSEFKQHCNIASEQIVSQVFLQFNKEKSQNRMGTTSRFCVILVSTYGARP